MYVPTASSPTNLPSTLMSGAPSRLKTLVCRMK
jgi:hypothetical protein